jgi:hypothetical protein
MKNSGYKVTIVDVTQVCEPVLRNSGRTNAENQCWVTGDLFSNSANSRDRFLTIEEMFGDDRFVCSVFVYLADIQKCGSEESLSPVSDLPLPKIVSAVINLLALLSAYAVLGRSPRHAQDLEDAFFTSALQQLPLRDTLPLLTSHHIPIQPVLI